MRINSLGIGKPFLSLTKLFEMSDPDSIENKPQNAINNVNKFDCFHSTENIDSFLFQYLDWDNKFKWQEIDYVIRVSATRMHNKWTGCV